MDTERVNKLNKNFKLRNIEVEFFETLEDVKAYILRIIPRESIIGIGHSSTLHIINMTQTLIDRGNIVYDKELAGNDEECKILKKKSLTSDWYITGSNAVSLDGRIVNIDHSGNRVAALSYGPEKVIIVVGKNKIVDTVEEAVTRVRNISCPLNARRAGLNPPCTVLNRCVDCLSEEKVCNYLSIIEGQCDSNRMKLLIVDEDCGY